MKPLLKQYLDSGSDLEEFAVLEGKCDVNIHYKSEALEAARISGSLENETLEQVMHAIGMAAQTEYGIEDSDIWIKDQSK